MTGMAHIDICNLTKRFKKTTALDGINLEINNNEFFVLFGPSGAGKTTLLKIIAGLENADVGEVSIGGKCVNCVEPVKRNVSMVFENYALYPHLTAYDNIASPMRSPLYRTDEEEIKGRVEQVASLMKIGHLLERLPSQLSNGERQRVALGRCLVRRPNVFLMDEPLAHLDAKLRNAMRAELKEMQSKFETTTIYVTHDYMEALSLGDRIAVINQGHIEQIGRGEDLFYRPVNEFVAKLIGEPEINIIPVRLVREDGKASVIMGAERVRLEIEDDVRLALTDSGLSEADLGIRGTDIEISLARLDSDYIKASVYSFEPIGNKTILIANVNDQLVKSIIPNDIKMEIDSEIYVRINMKNALFFRPRDGRFVARHGFKPNHLLGGA
jgi:multiple sugar transport system ATP-binding protein